MSNRSQMTQHKLSYTCWARNWSCSSEGFWAFLAWWYSAHSASLRLAWSDRNGCGQQKMKRKPTRSYPMFLPSSVGGVGGSDVLFEEGDGVSSTSTGGSAGNNSILRGWICSMFTRWGYCEISEGIKFGSGNTGGDPIGESSAAERRKEVKTKIHQIISEYLVQVEQHLSSETAENQWQSR